MPALLIGLLAGVGCYLMVAVVKAALGYDDSLDAFGVHGAGGTLGALLTGVFATSAGESDLQGCAGARAGLRHGRRQFPPDRETSSWAC